jgi:predicted Zn-ribbon and HTH transcriptional regulator
MKVAADLLRLGRIIRPEFYEDLPFAAANILDQTIAERKAEDGAAPVTCDNCGGAFSAKELKRCARCTIAWYCCVEHQRAAWRSHKADCFDVDAGDSGRKTCLD